MHSQPAFTMLSFRADLSARNLLLASRTTDSSRDTALRNDNCQSVFSQRNPKNPKFTIFNLRSSFPAIVPGGTRLPPAEMFPFQNTRRKSDVTPDPALPA